MNQNFCGILAFLLFLLTQHAGVRAEALLQTSIGINPIRNPHSTKDHVQPGTTIQLQTVIKNIGTEPSAPGDCRIQFAFPEALNQHENSVIFHTEELKLPMLKPGEEIELTFQTLHRWPSLFDFIREDWAMREYQAIATINRQKRLLSTLTVTFSAYYYEGASLNKPVAVSSAL